MTFAAEQAKKEPPAEAATSGGGEGWIVNPLAVALSGTGPS
jgi:hypothetical protein